MAMCVLYVFYCVSFWIYHKIRKREDLWNTGGR